MLEDTTNNNFSRKKTLFQQTAYVDISPSIIDNPRKSIIQRVIFNIPNKPTNPTPVAVVPVVQIPPTLEDVVNILRTKASGKRTKEEVNSLVYYFEKLAYF